MTADQWTALATWGLVLLGASSLLIAWRSGIFARRTEEGRRRPQIGFSPYPLRVEESQRHAMPPIASEAHWRFRAKASTRDPLDFTAYPTQRYSIYVDNGGLGPAVRVSIPYTLTVWDVDEQNV